MNSWRDHILKEFAPQIARLTLVADPDGLLTEEGIVVALRERGFELLEFDDPVAFRFSYESKYRSLWDRGEITDLVVILRSATDDLSSLPYDLLCVGRKLSFNLGDLFPNLSYPVIESLDRNNLDALYQAQMRYKPEKLGDNATKDFILRHVFEIAPELIKQPTNLLRVLLRLHYVGQGIPSMLDERFIYILRQNKYFDAWPLERIVSDREAFFEYLQERWPIFLEGLTSGEASIVSEKGLTDNLKYPGPPAIPFDHDDIRIYIDNLFLEGMLHPVQHPKSDMLSKMWVVSGIRVDTELDALRRLQKLMKSIEDSIPDSEGRHQDWLIFAHRWAEVIVLLNQAKKSETLTRQFQMLKEMVDRAFLLWIQKRYGGLYNQPPVPPVMVHHIPRAMERYMRHTGREKVALILIDGMAFDSWLVIKEEFMKQRPHLSIRERAIFGWIPTITSVSRQAAFAGKPPIYFPNSINTTERESALWSQFWMEHGFTQAEIACVKGVNETKIHAIDEITSDQRIRILGLIVDIVDKIMHGMELGLAGMHNQVRQWTKEGFLGKLIDLLLERNYKIFLTSDHGSIEAKGCGRPTEGSISDVRGERVRIYPNLILRKTTKEKFPEAMEWPQIGLPQDYLPLLAPDRAAFIHTGEQIIAHGGISLEELIVPYVQIERS
ncbi:MAG: BREX-3 system phosphatase PglZ [Candidatus Brocadia sp.]|jgi:hypothetical protein